jgi:hypothetical protein
MLKGEIEKKYLLKTGSIKNPSLPELTHQTLDLGHNNIFFSSFKI